MTPILRGICLFLCALMMFTLLDTTAKALNSTIHPIQITAVRYGVAFIVMVILLNPWKAKAQFKSQKLGLQIIRSVILLASTIFNFIALIYLQLDQTMAIIFMTPFIVALLAGPLLGEWIGFYRKVAIGIGFIGVLIVTNPFSQTLHWSMLLSLCSATAYALYSILTRKLAKFDSTETTVLHSNLWSALIICIVGIPFFTMPATWREIFLLFTMGVYGGLGHWLLIEAHKYAPASTLAPFLYMQMIAMITAGYLAFNQVPHAHTLVGSGIIIASGLYMLYREKVRPIAEK